MPYSDAQRQKEYQRDWVRRRRAECLAGKRCVDCGGDIRLQFHHRDPAQKISHRIYSWSKERLEAELAKCEVLCRKCHDHRHRLMRGPPQHGRKTTYAKYGCRCDLCKAAAAEYLRNTRGKARAERRAEKKRLKEAAPQASA